ncbi:MAG: hypothetical protein H0W44_05525 [Gammaproteobacteria bacterium]|nr:hypothetical protein [Gammaproteobacteria bacterium]
MDYIRFLLLGVVFGVYVIGNAQAQQVSRNNTQSVNPKIYQGLAIAAESIEAGRTKEGLSKLRSMFTDKLNPYERASIWSYIAYVYTAEKNYGEALKSYANVTEQSNIPEGMALSAIFAQARIHLFQENHDKTVELMQRWFNVATEPTVDAYVVMAQAHYFKGNSAEAVVQLEKAMVLVIEYNIQPKEAWLQLLRASYSDVGNVSKTIATLEQLIRLYPKEEYFTQLASMYSEPGREQQQLQVLETANDAGYLKNPNDLLVLVSLLMHNNKASKAADILEKALQNKTIESTPDNLRKLVHAYLLANEPEKALQILTDLPKLSTDGELYVNFGEAYTGLNRWQEAVDAFNLALKEEKLKQRDYVRALLAQALFYLGRHQEAEKIFKSLTKSTEMQSVATEWLKYLNTHRT